MELFHLFAIPTQYWETPQKHIPLPMCRWDIYSPNHYGSESVRNENDE